MVTVDAYYYTDPACPWSWALEPAVRRLEHEFADSVRIRYVMAGMAREFGEPEALVRGALEAGISSGMPVDPRLWWQAPPRSSYPGCLAVKAAAEQGDPGAYLRRLREGFMCRRRKLDTAEALLAEAREVPGLDLDRLHVDLGSHAILEAFAADLERAGGVCAQRRAPGTDRVTLPSFEFHSAQGVRCGVYGHSDYGVLRAAAVEAGAQPSKRGAPTVEAALERWPSLATAEIAELCRLPGPRAPTELWRLASEWQVKAEPAGSGQLWSLA